MRLLFAVFATTASNRIIITGIIPAPAVVVFVALGCDMTFLSDSRVTVVHSMGQARELGDRLMPAFKSASGVPFSDVNLKSGSAHKPTYVRQSMAFNLDPCNPTCDYHPRPRA